MAPANQNADVDEELFVALLFRDLQAIDLLVDYLKRVHRKIIAFDRNYDEETGFEDHEKIVDLFLGWDEHWDAVIKKLEEISEPDLTEQLVDSLLVASSYNIDLLMAFFEKIGRTTVVKILEKLVTDPESGFLKYENEYIRIQKIILVLTRLGKSGAEAIFRLMNRDVQYDVEGEYIEYLHISDDLELETLVPLLAIYGTLLDRFESYGGRAESLMWYDIESDVYTIECCSDIIIKLLRHQGGSAHEILVRTATEGDDKSRMAAVHVLGEICDARTVDILVNALKDDNYLKRGYAVDALRKIGDVRVIEPLIDVLKDENGDNRKAAAKALGELSDERSVVSLIEELLKEEIHRDVVDHAIHVCSKAELERRWYLFVRESCKAETVFRITVIEALGDIGDPRAVIPLLQILDPNKSFLLHPSNFLANHLRESAILALGRIGDKSAIEGLSRLLEKDESFKSEITASLASIGDEQAYIAIIDGLREGNSYTARCMLRGGVSWDSVSASLSALGFGKSIEAFGRLMSDENDEIRNTANEFLAKLDDPAIVDVLLHFLYWAHNEDFAYDTWGREDGDVEDIVAPVRETIIKLGRRAVDPLIMALWTDYQYRAAELLGEIGDEKAAVPLLIKTHQQDEDEGIRIECRKSLKKIGKEDLSLPEILVFVQQQALDMNDDFLHSSLSCIKNLSPFPNQLISLKQLLLSLVLGDTAEKIREEAKELLKILDQPDDY
ncbi:MAG: HEAT repeat domain-containing protein [Candidatus Odinarchaeota archaeon]